MPAADRPGADPGVDHRRAHHPPASVPSWYSLVAASARWLLPGHDRLHSAAYFVAPATAYICVYAIDDANATVGVSVTASATVSAYDPASGWDHASCPDRLGVCLLSRDDPLLVIVVISALWAVIFSTIMITMMLTS
jgi:hypothetical protein